MRARIEKLLAAEELTGSVPSAASSSAETLNMPQTPGSMYSDSQATRMPLAEAVGATIGRYKLLQKIGEGGFGVVFMAEQREPVQRKVALKIIKLGMDTHQVIARFEQERQALAMMDHTHIAKVLDAGATDTGRPYFVMELVTGDPITRYCDKLKMPIQERLELFVQVCQAVQHAHQKGIIHRDIKPTNVLVNTRDGRPHAVVIDFGIAKATAAKLTEKTLFTAHKQFIGTPEYMSPEQAEGSLDIDTRTDVYSLGVLLYELLTGTTPFDSRSLGSAANHEIEKIIREFDPPRPSTKISNSTDTLPSIAAQRRTEPKKLPSLIRGDLDWIVMKAMEKDRSRRYETANGLAADILRFLAGQPVVAAPPSRSYRFRKFVRRNRASLTMATVLALAVLSGLVMSAYGLVQARRERDAKIQALAATESALEREQSAVEEQRKARAESDAVAEFLGSMLLAAAPHEKGRETTVKSVLDAAGDGVSTRFTEQPLVQARLRFLMASTYQSLGLYRESETHARASLDARRKILGNDHPDTIAAIMSLAWNLHDQGRLDEAEPFFSEMREIQKKAGRSDDLNVLWSKNQLATAHMQAGRYAQAEALYTEALPVFERLLGKKDRKTLSLMNNLVVLYWNQGQLERAAGLARETYQLMVEVLGPKDPVTIGLQINLAILEQAVGNYARSEEIYLEALALQIKVVGETHVNTISIKTNMATLYNDMKQYEKGEAMAQDVITHGPKALGADHQLVLGARINLGLIYYATDRMDLAIETLRSVLPILQTKLGAQHPWTWEAQTALYDSLTKAGKSEEALSVRSELIGVLQTACEAEDADANVLDRLARMLLSEKQPTEPDVQGALAAAGRAAERSSRKNAAHLHTLARALKFSGEISAAVQTQREAIALLPPDSSHRTEYEAALTEFQAAADDSGNPRR